MDQTQITSLEKILKDLGYDLSEHADGQNDDAFKAAFLNAEQDFLKLANSDALSLTSDISNLDTSMAELNASLTKDQETIDNISNLKDLGRYLDDVSTYLPKDIRTAINAINPDIAKNFEHFVTFAEDYNAIYRAAVLAASQEYHPTTEQSAAISATQDATAQHANTPTPSFQNLTVTAEETKAAEAIGADKIKKLQAFLKTHLGDDAPNLQVNGTWDSATKTAYINTIYMITNNKDALSDITKVTELTNQALQQEVVDLQTGMGLEKTIARKITALEKQRSWGWTDNTWLDSNDITTEDIDSQIAAFKQQKIDLEKENATQAQVINALTNFSNILTGDYKPLLTLTHSAASLNLEPPTQNNDGTAQELPEALILEKFLSNPKLKTTIEDTAKMLGDSSFQLITPQKVDGIMDAGSQGGLQQVLSFLVSDSALGLSHYQNENGAVTYTPALGHAIIEKFNDPNNAKAQKLNTILTDAFAAEGLKDLHDPKDPDKKITASQFLVLQLNELYNKKQLKRDSIKDLDLITIQMDPIQAGILNFIIGFLPEGLIASFDGIMRQFTGGHGLLDLMPQLGHVEGVKKALGGMDELDPTQQLVESFKRSFKDSNDASDRQAMKDQLLEATAMMENLPFGSAERRQNYPHAVEKSLDRALAIMGDTKPGDPDFEAKLSEASLVYADSFKKNMHELSQNFGGAEFNSHPASVTVNTNVLLRSLAEDNFTINGQNGQVSNDEINRVISTYNNRNFDRSPHNHEPLIFTDENGKTFVAGINQPSNMFTIQHLPIADISKAIAEGASQEALSQTYPGYAMMNTTYRNFSNEYMRWSGASYNQAIIALASDPEISMPFSAVEHDASNYQQDQSMRKELKQSYMNEDERKKLYKTLTNEIRAAQKRAKTDGSNHTGAFNQTSGASTNIDPKTQELINLREMMQSDDKARVALAGAPKTFVSTGGKIYLFSHVTPDLGYVGYEGAFERDVTDEVARFTNLTAEKRAFYQKDPNLMQAHFPHLTTIAHQYPQYTNGFALAREIAGQQGLSFKPAPLSDNMPTWLQEQLKTSQNYDNMARTVANQPQLVLSDTQDGHVKVIAKGSQNSQFIGHDIGTELKRYNQLNNEQRQAIHNNPAQASSQFPRISEIAEQYQNFSPSSLAETLLSQADIRNQLSLDAPENEQILQQPSRKQ